jgi:hypothetical protein
MDNEREPRQVLGSLSNLQSLGLLMVLEGYVYQPSLTGDSSLTWKQIKLTKDGNVLLREMVSVIHSISKIRLTNLISKSKTQRL